jgi:REP element-mobilizing transposase RayT
MARAHRHYLPGQIWHLTHRCHERQFLLEFHRDRQAWRGWLFEARKRLGLCVLDYMVTSNHVHLLVDDREGGEVIPASMQSAKADGRASRAGVQSAEEKAWRLLGRPLPCHGRRKREAFSAMSGLY